MTALDMNQHPDFLAALRKTAAELMTMVGDHPELLLGKEASIFVHAEGKDTKPYVIAFHMELQPKGLCAYCGGEKVESHMTAAGPKEQDCRHCKGTGICPEPKCKCHHPVA